MRKGRLLVVFALLAMPLSARAQTTAASLQQMLWSYGDAADRSSWSGADGTYSVPLPDGRVAWLFSDTFLGPVNPNKSRPANAAFVHNSIVVQDGTQLSTILGPDRTTLMNPPDHAGFYWVGDGIVEGNELLVFVMRFVAAPIPYAFQQAGTDIARFSLPTMELKGITRMPLAFVPGSGVAPVSYGSAILQSGGYDYVYGVADLHIGKNLYVARVPAGHLIDGAWEYFTGAGSWSSVPALARTIATGVANELSVTATTSGFALITQQNSIGKAIMLSKASAPEGPWSTPTDVFDTPESNGRLVTYNAKAHKEFSTSTTLMVSYNVNSNVGADLYSNVDSYRPRFVEITLP